MEEFQCGLRAGLIPPVRQLAGGSMCHSLNLNTRKTHPSTTDLIFFALGSHLNQCCSLTQGRCPHRWSFPQRLRCKEFFFSPFHMLFVSRLLPEGVAVHFGWIAAGVKGEGREKGGRRGITGDMACFLKCLSGNWSPSDMDSQWDASCSISMWLSGGGRPAAP